MTFKEYLVDFGKSLALSQIESWEGDDPKMVAYWTKIIETDSEVEFIDWAQTLISGAMFKDDCGFGAFSFDASDPQWVLVDGKHNFPILTTEEVRENKRYDLDFFSSGYVPAGWDKDRSSVVWCCSIWDKRENKRLQEWYYGYDLDTVATVCWRLSVS